MGMHEMLRLPFRAHTAHRKRGNGFQALRNALRQAAITFSPYFGEQRATPPV
jgi:hypothetical protein